MYRIYWKVVRDIERLERCVMRCSEAEEGDFSGCTIQTLMTFLFWSISRFTAVLCKYVSFTTYISVANTCKNILFFFGCGQYSGNTVATIKHYYHFRFGLNISQDVNLKSNHLTFWQMLLFASLLPSHTVLAHANCGISKNKGPDSALLCPSLSHFISTLAQASLPS